MTTAPTDGLDALRAKVVAAWHDPKQDVVQVIENRYQPIIEAARSDAAEERDEQWRADGHSYARDCVVSNG